MWGLISQTRNQTYMPCSGNVESYHWTAKEVLPNPENCKNNLHSKLEDNKIIRLNYCWSLDINFKWGYYSLDMKFIVCQKLVL